MEKTIIAIDPDVDKSGYALLKVDKREFGVIDAWGFPQLLHNLHALQTCLTDDERPYIVLIEAGWLNKAHWHIKYADNKHIAAAKGNSAGRNHEVGRKIAEMCQYWGVPYKLIKPLTKIWKGQDRKITAAELERLTGWKKRTNQEMRDAALIAWAYSRLINKHHNESVD